MKNLNMTEQTTVCSKCYSYTYFWGRYVPPCYKCGYPELKTTEEYMKTIGVPITQNEKT